MQLTKAQSYSWRRKNIFGFLKVARAKRIGKCTKSKKSQVPEEWQFLKISKESVSIYLKRFVSSSGKTKAGLNDLASSISIMA